MAGRANGFTVSSTSVVVARKSPERKGLIFTSSADVAILKDQGIPATATNGVPVGIGFPLELRGKMATHEWQAIRLAGDTLLGVIELYGDDWIEGQAPEGGEPV